MAELEKKEEEEKEKERIRTKENQGPEGDSAPTPLDPLPSYFPSTSNLFPFRMSSGKIPLQSLYLMAKYIKIKFFVFWFEAWSQLYSPALVSVSGL